MPMNSNQLSEPHAEVAVTDNDIAVTLANGQTLSFQRSPLPELFIEWQRLARLQMFTHLERAGADAIRMQPAHLPVLATMGDGTFPINLTSRGIGLLPKAAVLEKYTLELESALEAAAGKDWAETLPTRIKAISQFYQDSAATDPLILGGLEIFEGRTPANIRANPLVSLLYTGAAPRFPSYQFNGVIEFLTPKDPRYRFLLAARELFAHDSFHVTQKRYPFGYTFHLVNVLDKTPYPRN